MLRLWYELVIRREHRRPGVTPLMARADSVDRAYSPAPRP